MRDAILGVNIPLIEIHLSNIYGREEFREKSYFSDIALGVVSGFGKQSYLMAFQAAKIIYLGGLMDIRKVKKLIEMLEESNLNEIEIKEGEEAVKLVKSNPIPGNFISSAPAIISEPTQQSPIAMPSAPSSEATVTQEISQTSDVLESGNKMNSQW